MLKCHLLLFYTTTNHFSIGLCLVTESGFYMITGNDKLSGWMRRSSKALLKAKLAPKNGHDHCLVCCLIHYSFLNPGETITSETYAQQIIEMY